MSDSTATAVWRALGPAANKGNPMAQRLRLVISQSDDPDLDAMIILQELLSILEADPMGEAGEVAELTITSYTDAGLREIEKWRV